ncbi:uncharacterized protein LOC144433663 [Glandiceps talaboti]
MTCASRFGERGMVKQMLRLASLVLLYTTVTLPIAIRLASCFSEECWVGSFTPYVLQLIFFLGGAILYGTHCPECMAPGKFDVVGHSHQFLHIAVAVATYIQLIGINWDVINRREYLKTYGEYPTFSTTIGLFLNKVTSHFKAIDEGAIQVDDKNGGSRSCGFSECWLLLHPQFLKNYLSNCRVCVQLALQSSLQYTTTMGTSQSKPDSINSQSVTDDEHSRDNLNDSVVSEHSIDATSPKGKVKGKKGRKKHKGSDDNDKSASDFEIIDSPKKGGSLHRSDNTLVTASSSRKSSLNSTCSNVSENFEIRKLDGSPKKYRIPRWNHKTKALKENVTEEKVRELNSKPGDSFVMIDKNGGQEEVDPYKSFVIVPGAEELNQFDTNQKIKDVTTIYSDKLESKQKTTATSPKAFQVEEKVEIKPTKQPEVFVSYSKKIAEREQANKTPHQEMCRYEETDLDQAFLSKQQSPSLEPLKGNKTVMSREEWFLSGSMCNDDRMGNSKLGVESSVSQKPHCNLDLSEMVHVSNTRQLGEKLQRTVPVMGSEKSWQTTDLDTQSQDMKGQQGVTSNLQTREPNGDWQKTHLNFTPNTMAKSKAASIYGTLPRGQQPPQRSRLIQRGRVMATDLDAYEWSRSADELDKVGVYAAVVSENFATRKLEFDGDHGLNDLSFRNYDFGTDKSRSDDSANKPVSTLTSNVTIDETVELHISETESGKSTTPSLSKNTEVRQQTFAQPPTKSVLTTDAIQLNFTETTPSNTAASLSYKSKLPSDANTGVKPRSAGISYRDNSQLPSDVVPDLANFEDPELDIYSAGAIGQTLNPPRGDRRQKAAPHNTNPYLLRKQPAKRIANVGEKKAILGYAEREWKGQTVNARTMRKGYERIPALVRCSNLRSIRGDNYCAIRAALYQALLNNNMNITLGEDLKDISEVPDWFLSSGYEWVKSWTFACRLRNIIDPLETMKRCLEALQEQIEVCKNTNSFEEREQKLLQVFNHSNADLDIQLVEAVKLLMLYNAIRLHEDNITGKEVPVFVWLLYARDTSETPKKFMWNHLNTVGDSGGLEQIEMFLLGHTLGVTLQVVRPSQVDRVDFITYYPDDHVGDWPNISMIAEDDRHYNIAMK